MEPDFKLSGDGDGTFILAGELDLATSRILLDSFHPPSLAGKALVFELSGLTFIDSSGVQSLLIILDALGTGRMTLRGIPPNVGAIFKMVGLPDLDNLALSDD